MGVEVPAAFRARRLRSRFPPDACAPAARQRTAHTAYPVLRYSGGAGSTAKMPCRVAYWPKDKGGDKGHRDEVDGKEFVGNHDIVVADGGRQRRYSPCGGGFARYIELTIETQQEGLVVEDLHGIYTGYPFERRQHSRRPRLWSRRSSTSGGERRGCARTRATWTPVLRAAQRRRRHAHPGAGIAVTPTGDARLMRNAIAQLDDSRTAEARR
jgi:hypothetical protein